jgi:hypothetical protein
MTTLSIVFLLFIGVAVQIAVIAVAVQLGTASIRRELLELQRVIVFMEGG